MIAAVLLPAIVVGLSADRFFLAVAYGLDLVFLDPSLQQGILGGCGSVCAQAYVVFGRAALVSVAFDLNHPVWMGADGLCRLGQRLLGVRPQVILVIIEIDVANVLIKQFFLRRRRRSDRRRRRSAHRYARGSFLRSTRTFGYQAVVGGLCG